MASMIKIFLPVFHHANRLNAKQLGLLSEMIWKGKNEAYYTDYVIYGSAKPMADQAEEVDEE